MVEDIFKLLSLPGSPTTVLLYYYLLFDSMLRYPISRGRAGEPFQRGVKYTGVHGKNCDFRLKLPFTGISEKIRETPMLLYGTFIGIRKS